MPQLVERLGRLERTGRRMVGSVVFGALLMGGVQLYLAGQVSLGGVLFAGAGLALIWTILVK
jgi:hypothetical protein